MCCIRHIPTREEVLHVWLSPTDQNTRGYFLFKQIVLNILDEFKKQVVKDFSNLKNKDDLALLLDKVNQKFEYFIKDDFRINSQLLNEFSDFKKEYYTYFDIKKKSGEIRTISAPVKPLKTILKSLNFIFQCIYTSHVCAHGFVWKKSVVTNANNHISKKFVYNIDLKDFFTSINIEKVRAVLKQKIFNLKENEFDSTISNIIDLTTNLCCFIHIENNKKVLPQGSPTSPIISNIICEEMDKELYIISKKYMITYSRYADDITFSSMHNFYQLNSNFLIEISRIIISYGFELNDKKTRLQKFNYRQVVTGLTVNEKINVSRKYVKHLRTLIHLVRKYGLSKAQFIYSKNDLTRAKTNNRYNYRLANIEDVIYGKLMFMRMVKGENDSTFLTLKKQFENLDLN